MFSIKGHSVTTKQSKDGRVDSLQTLHNLEEGLVPFHSVIGKFMLDVVDPQHFVPYILFLDELAGFEENWKTNAENVLPGWSNDFNLLENAGTLIELQYIYLTLIFFFYTLGKNLSISPSRDKQISLSYEPLTQAVFCAI